MVIRNLRDQESLNEIRADVERLLQKNTYNQDKPLNNGNPIIVSGNHRRKVGIGTYPRGRILAYVTP